MALARERDLEAGRMSLGRASLTRTIILEETESIGNDDESINASVKEVPLTLPAKGVEETDYGTMTASAKGEGKRNSVKRPGYVRQVTSESMFKDPVWGKKTGGDE